MTRKSTYKLTEIARQLGKMRTTVVDWSNQFREYLPTVGAGASLRYTEKAIEVFKTIARLREEHKSIKHIKEHLQYMSEEKAAHIGPNEETALPGEQCEEQTASVKSFEEQVTVTPVHVPPGFTAVQLSKETVDLRNTIETLTRKIEASRISKIAINNAATLQLSNDVTELRSLVLFLTKRVEAILEGDNRYAEEVAELRGLVEELSQEINNKLAEHEQGIMIELAAKNEAWNQRLDGISEEVNEMRSLVQLLAQEVADTVDLDFRSEFASREEALYARMEELARQIAEQQALIDQFSKIMIWKPQG